MLETQHFREENMFQLDLVRCTESLQEGMEKKKELWEKKVWFNDLSVDNRPMTNAGSLDHKRTGKFQ